MPLSLCHLPPISHASSFPLIILNRCGRDPSESPPPTGAFVLVHLLAHSHAEANSAGLGCCQLICAVSIFARLSWEFAHGVRGGGSSPFWGVVKLKPPAGIPLRFKRACQLRIFIPTICKPGLFNVRRLFPPEAIITYAFAILFKQLTEGSTVGTTLFQSVPESLNTLLLPAVFGANAEVINQIPDLMA